MACTRTTVFICQKSKDCAKTDPRFDEIQSVWVERKTKPKLLLLSEQPVLDCIDFDSDRSTNTYNEVRTDDPASDFPLLATKSASTNYDSEIRRDTDTADLRSKNRNEAGERQAQKSANSCGTYFCNTQRTALYIKEGTRVCYDGFVFEYTQHKVGNSAGVDNFDIGLTRNGFGAYRDTMLHPYLPDEHPESDGGDETLKTPRSEQSWNILNAFPNPQVEERRILPEVNCTFWEPHRPYLKGDIVCRYDYNTFSKGPNARSYKLHAFMCQYRRTQTGNDNTFDWKNERMSQSKTSQEKFAHGCGGPVWDSQLNYFTDRTAADSAATKTTASLSSDTFKHQTLFGSNFYWMPIEATPVLQTERQFTQFQTCIPASSYKSVRRRRDLAAWTDQLEIADMAASTNLKGHVSLPFSQMDRVTGTDADTSNDKKCMVTDSFQYAFEDAGLHVVPNWDKECK